MVWRQSVDLQAEPWHCECVFDFLYRNGLPKEFAIQHWQLYLVILAGWINRQQQFVIDYLRTEKADGLDPDTLKQISVFDLEDLTPAEPQTDSAELR